MFSFQYKNFSFHFLKASQQLLGKGKIEKKYRREISENFIFPTNQKKNVRAKERQKESIKENNLDFLVLPLLLPLFVVEANCVQEIVSQSVGCREVVWSLGRRLDRKEKLKKQKLEKTLKDDFIFSLRRFNFTFINNLRACIREYWDFAELIIATQAGASKFRVFRFHLRSSV